MVKIITQNVRGLKNKIKRRGIFNRLRENADIVCLQETHSELKNEEEWNLEWHGNNYWSHGSNDSRGVAILVKSTTPIEVLDYVSDNEGRFIILHYTENGQKFILLNLYAPNTDEPRFFMDAFKCLDNYDRKRIIVGDFNTTLNSQIDRYPSSSNNNDKSAEVINKYLEDTLCSDIWRCRNPEKRTYTYQRSKPTHRGSRLDYIIVETSMEAWVSKVEIIPGFRTDHSAVRIDMNPYEIKRGRGMWRLNNQILYETEYVQHINEVLKNSEMLSVELDPTEKWESIKLNVIATTQAYCYERSQNKKLIFSQLEEIIAKYEETGLNQLNSNQTKIYKKSKLDFEKLVDEKTQCNFSQWCKILY